MKQVEGIIPDMNQPFQAKFERGQFRPLEPIDLADESIVSLVVVASEAAPPAEDPVVRQQTALAVFLENAKHCQGPTADDQLTNRDHDRIIYGP